MAINEDEWAKLTTALAFMREVEGIKYKGRKIVFASDVLAILEDYREVSGEISDEFPVTDESKG